MLLIHTIVPMVWTGAYSRLSLWTIFLILFTAGLVFFDSMPTTRSFPNDLLR